MISKHNWDWLNNTLSINPSEDKISYNLDLKVKPEFKKYSQIDLDITIYPYSKELDSKDIKISPLTDYWEDLGDGQKSIYRTIQPIGNKIFALILGLSITLVLAFFRPDQLTSGEVIVSLVGVYLVGKELWSDLNNFLERVSQKYFIRWYPQIYSLELITDTTLSNYTQKAREKRFNNNLILPSKFDLIKQSNSQTIRLDYRSKSLFDSSSPTVRLGLIEIENNKEKYFKINNSQIGIKLSLTKTFLGVSWTQEFFQALDSSSSGSLNNKNKWLENTALHRKTITIGRIKIYLQSKQKSLKNIINWSE